MASSLSSQSKARSKADGQLLAQVGFTGSNQVEALVGAVKSAPAVAPDVASSSAKAD